MATSNNHELELMKEKYIGMKSFNKHGETMVIVEYRNCDDIDVYFPKYNTVEKNKTVSNFKKGRLTSVFTPTVFKVGYLGEDYECNDCNTTAYKEWYSMMRRCYSDYRKNKAITYIDCEAVEEWHNFSNFKKWHNENYYTINDEKMYLDKDIFCKSNKTYSPKTCVYVNREINNLFTKRQNDRGDLPIGVTRLRDTFLAQLSKEGKRYRKIFKTPNEAFEWYKIEKEKYIKEVAEKYKKVIPNKLYKAMYDWRVDKND